MQQTTSFTHDLGSFSTASPTTMRQTISLTLQLKQPNKSIIVALNLVALMYVKLQFLPANRQGHTITLGTRHNLNQIPQQNFKMANL